MDLTPYVKNKSIRRKFLTKVNFCKHGKRCKQCCWLWKGYTSKKLRYGLFYICVISIKPRKTLSVSPHRFMFTLRYGHTDLFVLHTCDTPACNNYNHLYAGTPKENMQDMVRKNRTNNVKGEKHYAAKLTIDTVLYMFSLRELGFTYTSIGLIVGVSRQQATNILLGRNWKHTSIQANNNS